MCATIASRMIDVSGPPAYTMSVAAGAFVGAVCRITESVETSDWITYGVPSCVLPTPLRQIRCPACIVDGRAAASCSVRVPAVHVSTVGGIESSQSKLYCGDTI